jgi:hypothetical protein
MIAGDEYESWYEMASDLTSPSSSHTGPADLQSAEGRAHAEASVSEFAHYLRTIGEPYNSFAANRRERPAAHAENGAIPRAGSQPVSMEEVPKVSASECGV